MTATDTLLPNTTTDKEAIEYMFLDHYNNHKDETTYQNATQSYLRVRPQVSVASARVLGHNIVTKNVNLLARDHMSRKGFTLALLAEFAAKRLMETKQPAWFDRLVKLLGYENPVLLQQNFQFNNGLPQDTTPISTASQGDKQEFTADFVEFLKAKHAKKPVVEEGKISP